MSDVFWFNPSLKQTAYANDFATFNAALQQRGELITQSPHSKVYRYATEAGCVYIKLYFSAGKKLRRFIGRSRNRAEWENLRYFEKLAIAAPTLIAYGERRICGLFSIGVTVTKEIPNSCDLAEMATKNPEYLKQKTWIKTIMQQVAAYTAKLHQQGFIHNDLKWRNILVDKNAATNDVYFIDCPVGRKRFGWLRGRGIIKDLACLDKVAKQVLTRSQRLRFYYYYIGQSYLDMKHKQQINKIIHFFSGRE